MLVRPVMNENLEYIYISGGITNVPDYGKSFLYAKRTLESYGYKVINPVEIPHTNLESWTGCVRLDLAYMELNAYGVCILNDWEKSKGANLEVTVAKGLDMRVAPLAYWVERAKLSGRA